MAEYQSNMAGKGSGMKFRNVLILLLLAFAGGATLAGWAVNHYSLFGFGRGVVAPAPTNIQPSVATPKLPVPDIPFETTPPAAAPAGPTNGARAEAMLVAFAARRAVDSGTPLGYVADQLRQRFGGTHPQAVATILNAEAQPPVTLATLQSELKAMGSTLTVKPGSGLFGNLQREMGELFVLRKAGALSNAPSEKMKRAITAADAGNIAGAVAEVQGLPGAALAKDWLIKARAFAATHKALDAIEQAAMAMPVAVPAPMPVAPQATPQSATTTDQPAPVFDQ